MRQLAARIVRHQQKGLLLREMGYVLLAGGTAHFVAVTVMYVANGFPSHDRIGYIYFIGVIQLVVGCLDLLAHRSRGSDQQQAQYLTLLSAVTITAYVLIILPTYPDFSAIFKLAPAIYLIYHWWAVLKIRKQVKAGSIPL